MPVPQIDFLPRTYHRDRRRQRDRVRHRVLLGLFLACLLAGTFQQRQTFTRLVTIRDRLQADSLRVTTELSGATGLRRQLEQVETHIALHTVLQHRLPATRLFASLCRNRPNSVALLEIDWEYAAREHSSAPPAPPPLPRDAPPPPPIVADLERLAHERASHVIAITVNGLAPDDVALATYMAELQRDGLFSEVKLLFTDSQTVLGEEYRTFSLRLTVQAPEPPRPPAEGTLARAGA